MMRLSAIAVVCLLLTGCAHMAAQGVSGFSPSSRSVVYNAHTYSIGAEATLQPGFAKADLPMVMPQGVVVDKLEGTVSLWADCADAEALADIVGYQVILKNSKANMFIHYDISVVSNGNLHVESDASCQVNWEFQGLVHIAE